MLTLTRQGLLLSLSATVIPSQGSSDVPVAVVNDINTYVGYTLEPRVGYYLNGIYKSTVCTYDTSAKTFSVPAEAFKQIGIIDITLALIDNANANHIETCQTVHATVNKAPLGTVVLPDQTTWQDYVNSYMNQLFDSNYKPQFDQIQQDLENLVTEAQQQQQTAEQQQTQIDNAISVMGEYQIVSNDPVQIQFKQGDGTYGPTVDLGDGLASKSMVNAGYYQSIGSQYSGAASDYGIQVEEIVGAYTQETTTGAQLFDASKLSTYSEGGATITNNGDGSFTISGSGEITDSVAKYYNDTNLKPKIGSLNLNIQNVTNPYFYAQLVSSSYDVIKQVTSYSKSVEITEDDVTNTSYMRFGFYAINGYTIKAGTIKPMVYQDGDGTWEPYTGGAPSPNPDYAQEMQAVEISELYSSGKNLFSGLIKGTGINSITGAEQVSDVSSCSDYIPVKAGQEYYISGLSNTINSFIAAYDYEKNFIGRTSGAVASGRALNNTTLLSAIGTGEIEKLAYLRVTQYVSTGNSGTIDDVDGLEIMLNVGDTAEPYTPYTGADTVTLSEPLILRALPNGVADSYEDGVITRRVGVAEFDGSSDENWILNTGNDTSLPNHYQFYYNSLSINLKYQGSSICDKAIVLQTDIFPNTEDLSITTGNFINVFIIKDDLTEKTVNAFKTWLQSNPITVWYELATPTTETFEIPRLQSFYPFTNAWCDSVVQPQQITWNVLTGKSSILDGNGNLIQQGYMTPQDNLLINSDFRSGIINQKGQTQYVHSSGARTYGIDCWYVTGENSSMAINDKFLSLNLHNNGDFGCVLNIDKTNEKYLTFTIQRNLVEAQSVTFDVSTMNFAQDYFFDIDENTKLGIYFWDTDSKKAWLYIRRNGVTNIDFMKLERGQEFTGMPWWNEYQELDKCIKYFDTKSSFRLPMCERSNVATVKTYSFSLPRTHYMHKIPTISVMGNAPVDSVSGICLRKFNDVSQLVHIVGYSFEVRDWELVIKVNVDDSVDVDNTDVQLFIGQQFIICFDAYDY